MGFELSKPPTIEQRVRAAIADDEQYQIIHYNRCEGASTAVHLIARDTEDIIVLSSQRHYGRFVMDGIKFLDYNSRIPDGIGNKTIIADVVPPEMLSRWRVVMGMRNKMIVLKGEVFNSENEEG